MTPKNLAPAFVFLFMSAEVLGQPMSAIDWLTNSVTADPKPTETPEPVTENGTVGEISVKPLDKIGQDGKGTISPGFIGLNENLWENSDPRTLIRLINGTYFRPETPTLRAFFFDLLSVSASVNVTPGSSGEFYLARIDKLLSLGHLDRADELLGLSDLNDPRFFRRWFDLRLLTGTEDVACERLSNSPDLSPTFPATIFCLARTGNWDVAAITLDTAEVLGLVTPSEDALLLRFLDETNAEDHGPLTLPTQITPLTFRLFEAVGEPISTEILPREMTEILLLMHS